jgi:hypothetical protein
MGKPLSQVPPVTPPLPVSATLPEAARPVPQNAGPENNGASSEEPMK